MHDEIVRFLEEHHVEFTIHQHPPSVTVQDALDTLPFPLEQFLKTVVFRVKDGDWLLAAVRGPHSVDYRKLATASGVRRDRLVRLSAQEIEAGRGFQVGGICPIPLRAGVRAIYDTHTTEMDRVYCGAGRNDRTLGVRVADLLRATGAPVLPIVKEDRP